MKTALILTMTLCAGLLFAQNEKKIDSKVVSATVFKNRALVTREAQAELQKGKHKLVFSNLPVDLLDESVRVSAGAQGSVKILDVRVEQRFTAEIQQKNIKALENQIDSLNQLVQICRDKITVFNSKKEFIESLKAQSSKYINEKMLLNLNNTKEWTDMLSFVDNNLSGIYTGIREQSRREDLLQQNISSIKSEISQSKGKKTRNFKEVIVNVETAERGQVKLFPSYLVQNAGWYPLYDARVMSDSKQIELHYFGMLQQSTGEDWNDVALTLSTAEPMSVKSLPKLERWFIDTKPLAVRQSYNIINNGSENPDYHLNYERNWGLPSGTGTVSGNLIDKSTGEALMGANVSLDGTSFASSSDVNGRFFIPNVVSSQYTLTVNMVGYIPARVFLQVNEKNTANLTIPLSVAPLGSSNEVVVTAQRAVVQKDMTQSVRVRSGRSDAAAYSLEGLSVPKEEDTYTNVFAKELSTTFEIPANNSIPSDNTYHKVTIAINRSPVDFTYTSMPRIASGVYLKGKMANKENYPLLEGEINIFVDNDFINRTYLNTIVPTDTLELALGIDERMQVKKVLLNKFQETKGLLGGKRQITYDYEIQIENNRPTEESVFIYDQLPIAMNEDIQIDLLEPKKEKNELGSERKLEWNLKLKPGEKKVIPVKYQVAYPNNLSVFGLE